MQAFGKASALARRLRGLSEPHHHEPSPERSATASSGTYRAVRPTAAEVAAAAGAGTPTDSAKVEGLRFEVDVGIWRGDAEYIASRVVDDAECIFDPSEAE